MRNDAQAVLLLLLGGTLLKISVTGTYVRYVKPGLLPLLVVAAGVLIVVAVITLLQVLRTPAPTAPTASAGPAAAADHDEPHHTAHDEPRVGWLLLVPPLALLLLSPPALGSFQASRNGTALSAQASSQAGSDFPALPEGDPVRISVLDYASRAVFDEGRSLAGRRIVLSGFIIAGPAGQPYLARMIVNCCAADARPVKVGLAGDVPPGLAPDAWIEVEGT